MPASYFLGTRCIDNSLRDYLWTDTTRIDNSIAFWCVECGRDWGRVHAPLGPSITRPVLRACSGHAPADPAGGSFIHPWLSIESALAILPPAVLAYEAKLALTKEYSA